jgi:hypothetical protein
MPRCRRAIAAVLAVVVAGAPITSAVAAASPTRRINPDIPLPPPRPAELRPLPLTHAASAPAAEQAPAPTEADEGACKALFAEGATVAVAVPPVHDGEICGMAAPVRLEAIILPDARHVALQPAPLVHCDLAAALARWVVEDVAPMFRAQNRRLDAIIDAEGYSCRARNHVAGAKLSEHAHGNAIDIASFVLERNHRLALTSADAKPFVALLRASACARFATVLGPGPDGFHESHIHLDLEQRRNNASLCQWKLD